MATMTQTETDHPVAGQTTSSLEEALTAAKERYSSRNPKSKAAHEHACQFLPGGNTRTALHTAPFPLCMKSGKDYQVTDEDGHTYTDLLGELTAGLYGHTHPIIHASIQDALTTTGLSLGCTSSQESTFAALLCSRFGLDKLRFTNSGTEANLHALQGAKCFTSRRKVLVFSGGYHGGALGFADGVADNCIDRDEWIVGRYNDVAGTKKLIEEHGKELAAVLVEPMQGSAGCIPGKREFLMQIQESCDSVGAVFILDEVMTSRLGNGGGVKGIWGLKPGLVTKGKYLGGGMSIGVFGGRDDIMALYDPRQRGHLAHSGTFNNNTLTMHAGYTGLSQIYTPEAAIELNEQGEQFRAALNAVSKGTKMSVTGWGSLTCTHFTEKGVMEVSCVEDIPEIGGLKDLLYMEMLEEGFWVSRRGFSALMLAMPQEELDRFVHCVAKFLVRHRALVEF